MSHRTDPHHSERSVRSSGSSSTRRGQRARVAIVFALVLAGLASVTAHAAPDDGEPRTDSTSVPSTPSTTTTAPPAPTSTTVPPTTVAPTTVPPAVTTTTSTSLPSTTTTVAPPVTAPDPGEDDDPVVTVVSPDDPADPGASSGTVPPTTPPTPTQPTARNVTAYPSQIQHILATIRYLESRGIYTLPPNKGNASGAYQFIASTWDNYGGYAHAYLAPPDVQDERAALDVTRFLRQFDNDVSMVPVMWYLPAAVREPWRMDVVPSPENGNTLTIREYQTRWLAVFAFMSGQPLWRVLPDVDVTDVEGRRGEPPSLPEPIGDEPSVAFPVLGPSRVAVPDCDGVDQVEVGADLGDGGSATPAPSLADLRTAGLCATQAPAIVFGVKLQPVLAITDGIVTDVVDRPGDDEPITVTVTGEDGISVVYSGFNDDNPGTADGAAPAHLRLSALARVGGQVRAGQVIGFMGDTDPLPIGVRADVPTDRTVVIDPDAVAPHVRITMVDVAGRPLDAFGPVVDALFRQTCTVGIGQWSIPARGGDHTAVTVETTDVHRDIDSEWVITSSGQVTASGWAAMINPNEGCGYAPSRPHGPGEAGSDQGLWHWLSPVDLPTSVWVRLAMQDELSSPGGLLRPG